MKETQSFVYSNPKLILFETSGNLDGF